MSARRRRNPHAQGDRPLRIGGEEHPVIGRMTIRHHRYLLLEELGGPGRTRYKALDPDAGGELRSILVLPHSPAAEQYAQILKRLPPGNANLPRVWTFDRRDDCLRLVLTWIEGLTLKKFLQRIEQGRAQRVSAYEAVRLIRGLAHGLRTLHNHAQLVHGDLSPSNLILTRKGSELVMIDFGSAWLAERTAFRAATDGMTPVYAAPELQNDDAGINGRCDQFSASVILYQLLTREIPYANYGGKAGRPEYVDRLQEKYIPPSRLSPDAGRLPRTIWRGIDRIVQTGLTLDPADRYPTTAAWLDDLEAVYLEMRYRGRHQTPGDGVLTRVIDWLAKRFGRDNLKSES